MSARRFQSGFTLIELLLVLTIVGILAAIAIPSYLGSKDYAKYVGEARASAQILRMALESYKSDNGVYPPVADYEWRTADGATAATFPSPNPVPSFQLTVAGSGSLQLNLVVNANRQAYTIRAMDFKRGRNYFAMDQQGHETNY